MKRYAGEEFLNKIYRDLIHSDIVKKTSIGRNKNEDVHIYMDRLYRITNKAIEHGHLNVLKKLYYDKYVIKPEDVPESYFELQKRIALERGFGHVEYDEYTKQQEIEHIINEQKESLNSWIDYFASVGSDIYPTWFKYYCFQGMVRLGSFDKEKGSFTKRTKSTVKPFVELNPEAIAFIYDELVKVLDNRELNDREIERLLKSGSFSKVYAYIIQKLDSVNKENSTGEDGIWKKYNQGSNPEVLFSDIHGKGTGWCTAGGIETAKAHLDGGDFYVYFTKDFSGEYTNPRIAIRTDYGKIAEIRGIAENQNLENGLEKAVERKLDEFPDKEEYKKKVADMEMLTIIYNKDQNNQELSREELRFLYEIDENIIGFGWCEDPRIEEILERRSEYKDLPVIFNCTREEISFSRIEALCGNKIFHYGCLDLNLEKADGVKLPKKINGDLYWDNLRSATEVVFPEEIGGSLFLDSLEKADGVKLPKKINGDLDLCSLTSADGVEFPEEINGYLNLRSLETAKGLKFSKNIKYSLDLSSLTDADEVEFPEKVNGDLSLVGLETADGVKFPEEVNGNLFLGRLETGDGVKLPKKIDGYLDLNNLKSAAGMIIPDDLKCEVFCPAFDNDINKLREATKKADMKNGHHM